MEFEEDFEHKILTKQLNINKIISKTKNLTDNEKRHIVKIKVDIFFTWKKSMMKLLIRY